MALKGKKQVLRLKNIHATNYGDMSSTPFTEIPAEGRLRVFSNILNNAVEAAPNGSTVLVLKFV